MKHSKPRIFIPIEYAMIAAFITYCFTRSGLFRGILDAGHIPAAAAIVAVGIGAGLWKCVQLKREILEAFPENVRFVPTNLENYPTADAETLRRHTDTLEARGFFMEMDYTWECEPLALAQGYSRLFTHAELRCTVEVSQHFAPSGDSPGVWCAVFSVLDCGWRLSSSNQWPSFDDSLRSSKSLLIRHPDFDLSELLENHLEMRKQIAHDLGVEVVGEMSPETCFALTRQEMQESRRQMSAKNILGFLMELDRFKKKPKYEWLGDYPKVATERKKAAGV